MLHGVTYWYMGGQTIHGFPSGFRQLGSGYWAGIPVPVYVMFAFLVMGAFFAQRTTYGQEIYAIGANRWPRGSPASRSSDASCSCIR